MLSTNGVNEVFKTGRLVQHFYETNRADRQVNILQFLIMHYITDDVNDKDNELDKQLPFKSNELPISGNTIISVPYRHVRTLDVEFATLGNKFLFLRKDGEIHNNFNVPIWHPPKHG